MAVEYCHACDTHIDLDWNCDGEYLKDDEYTCGNCIQDRAEEAEEEADLAAKLSKDIAEGRHVHKDCQWEESDARGIYIAKVCEECVEEVLKPYREVILTGYDQSDVDEPIEEEDY